MARRITSIPVPVTIAIATSTTVGSAASISLSGFLRGVLVDAPDLDSTNTLTVALTDASGFTLYSVASLAKSTKSSKFVDANNYPLQVPLVGAITVTVTASGAQSADRTIPVYLLVDSLI